MWGKVVIWFWLILDCIWPDYLVCLLFILSISRFISSISHLFHLSCVYLLGKIWFLILKFLIFFRPFVFYRLARFVYSYISVWYFLVVLRHLVSLAWHCLVILFLRVRYVELPFVILRVGVLLFYSTKEVGIDGPSVFLYFWLLFVQRFSLPLAYSVWWWLAAWWGRVRPLGKAGWSFVLFGLESTCWGFFLPFVELLSCRIRCW